MLFLSVGFFIRSIDSAHAAPNAKNYFQAQGNKIGKYMISMDCDAKGNPNLVVWDTETGKSQFWFYNQKGVFEKYVQQLPVDPM